MYKVLILVPHPDDEIIVAGGLFNQFENINANVSVCITTNGDYISNLAETRIFETLKARKIFNYDNLYILGYGDDYQGKHIYEGLDHEVLMSVAGKYETYNLSHIKTYHQIKYGRQAKYTRNNYKNDLRELILDIKANLIICVDNDKHVEHRTLSLLFDEVIGEIIKSTDYRPIILKMFAYIGAYDAIRDYFYRPMIVTKPSYKACIKDNDCVFPYDWNERIQIANLKSNYSLLFWKSPIFKALKAHRTQRASIRFDQICNADIVAWERRTDNLLLKANIEASSGNISFINDFKLVETENIRSNSWIIPQSVNRCWSPSNEDVYKTIRISFNESVTISKIVIYQNIQSHFDCLELEVDNRFKKQYESDGYKTSIEFFPLQNVKLINLRFKGTEIYINEIEVFESINSNIWRYLPLERYNSPKECFSLKFKMFHKILFDIYKIINIDKRMLVRFLKKYIYINK